MQILRILVWPLSIVTMVPWAIAASAQNYPYKTIRVLAAGIGGGGDFAARIIAQGIAVTLGQAVIVDNRPSGIILGEIVAKAPPDGYTLLVTGSSFWLAPLLQDNVPWDPVRDFSPITLATSSPNILVVHPSLPVKSVKELITLAKGRPERLNYASGATGSTPHLAAELFKAMAGVDMVRIAYKSAGAAVNDLIGGQVQLMFAVAATVVPHVKSGRLKALAVTSAQPSALVPDVPTVTATGLPGYESVSILGILAPAGTPVALVNRLNKEIVQVLNRADVKDKFFNAGADVVHSSPREFAAKIKSEITGLGKVIKDAGIKAE